MHRTRIRGFLLSLVCLLLSTPAWALVTQTANEDEGHTRPEAPPAAPQHQPPPGSANPPHLPAEQANLPFAPGEIILKFRDPGLMPLDVTPQRFMQRLQAVAPALVTTLASTHIVNIERMFTSSSSPKDIRARFPQRAQRARSGATTPDLRGIWKLTTTGDDPPAQAALIAALNQHSAIAWAEPNWFFWTQYTPSDPRYPEQWQLRNTGTPGADIHAEPAWDLAPTRGAGVVVAVVDTGILYTHPDLAANMWTNPGEIAGNDIDDDGNGCVDDVVGCDFTDLSRFPLWNGDPVDDDGHGTHVAGIVAAEEGNGTGVVGVAFTARLMALKACYASTPPSGRCSGAAVALAIRYAADHGADIIAMGLGGPNAAQPVQDAISYAASLGVILVAPAGNEDGGFPWYPAAYPETIAVTASDRDDARAPFSNYGAHIDVTAPGADLLSTVLADDYAMRSGTSMATAVVSGVAALILGQNPTSTTAQVRQILWNSADDVDTAGWDPLTGYGRVNAERALADRDARAYPVARIAAPLAMQTVAPGTEYRVIGTAQSTGFQAYVLEVGAGLAPTVWRELRRSVVPVSDGELGRWMTGPSAPGVWTLRLTVSDASLPPRVATTYVRLDGMLKPGWPVLLNTSTFVSRGFGGDRFLESPSPTVADLDGDGDQEILLASNDGFLYALHHDATPVIGWPVRLSDLVSQLASQSFGIPAIGDVDRDGRAEVAAYSSFLGRFDLGRYTGHIHLLRGDGTPYSPAWPLIPPDLLALPPPGGVTMRVPPTLADIDGDGDLELIIGPDWSETARVRVFQHDGSVLAGYPVDLLPLAPRKYHDATTGALAVGDVNGDGTPELAMSIHVGDRADAESHHVLRADGTPLSPWPVSFDFGPGGWKSAYGGISLADLDADGDLELGLAGGLGFPNPFGRLRITEHDARARWDDLGDISEGKEVVFGDLDRDGVLEFGYMSEFDVRIHDREGGARDTWFAWVTAGDSGLIFGDVSGDGFPDVIFGTRAPGPPRLGQVLPQGLHAFHHDGTAVAEFPKHPRLAMKEITSTPLLTDLERDGVADLVVSTVDGALYVYDGGAFNHCDPDIQPWPKLHATPGNTRLYERRQLCPPVCGNGILDAGEECDDGNTEDGDGCSAACVTELCPANNTCGVCGDRGPSCALLSREDQMTFGIAPERHAHPDVSADYAVWARQLGSARASEIRLYRHGEPVGSDRAIASSATARLSGARTSGFAGRHFAAWQAYPPSTVHLHDIERAESMDVPLTVGQQQGPVDLTGQYMAWIEWTPHQNANVLFVDLTDLTLDAGRQYIDPADIVNLTQDRYQPSNTLAVSATGDVVWTTRIGTGLRIARYDHVTGQVEEVDPAGAPGSSRYWPDIWQQLIAWRESGNASRVVLYNAATNTTEFRSPEAANITEPEVHDNLLIWGQEDYACAPNWSLLLYHRSTGKIGVLADFPTTYKGTPYSIENDFAIYDGQIFWGRHDATAEYNIYRHTIAPVCQR